MNGGNGSAGALHAAEALLGSLLIDSTAWEAISGTIKLEHFERPDHQLIFAAIAELAAEGLARDVVTVGNTLERTGKLVDAGGLAYLATLAAHTLTAANITTYAELMIEGSRVRRLKALGGAILDAVRCGESSEEILTRLNGFIGSAGASAPSSPVEPLSMTPVSTWSHRPAPAPRDWVWKDLVPGRRVTSFMGNGGDGKTTTAIQIAVHVAMSRPLYGLSVSGGPVLGLFCEDEEDELQRRISATCAAENIPLEQLDQLIALSREGMDNLLCTFDKDRMVTTPLYARLDATVGALKPRLLILDTLADLFGGDYMSTAHARQFVKTALGGLCVRHGAAVLLVAHPSAAGMERGDGSGFSTAWHNSVRSRLYMRRPSPDDSDRRVLEIKKANYAAGGLSIPLIWQAGVFVPDGEPTATTAPKAARTDTRLAVATMDCLRSKGPSGQVVSFKALYDDLQARGDLPQGNYETVRKPLQRTLKALEADHLITQCSVPRGYRIRPSTA